MSGDLQVDYYKPERGLIEVFTNLSGSYCSIEDVATKINISMTKVSMILYTYMYALEYI